MDAWSSDKGQAKQDGAEGGLLCVLHLQIRPSIKPEHPIKLKLWCVSSKEFINVQKTAQPAALSR